MPSDIRCGAMQWLASIVADIGLASPVAVVLPDTVAATVMDRSMTVAPATATVTVTVLAMATMDALAMLLPSSAV